MRHKVLGMLTSSQSSFYLRRDSNTKEEPIGARSGSSSMQPRFAFSSLEAKISVLLFGVCLFLVFWVYFSLTGTILHSLPPPLSKFDTKINEQL